MAITLTCKKHPRYQALLYPKAGCIQCSIMFDLVNQYPDMVKRKPIAKVSE